MPKIISLISFFLLAITGFAQPDTALSKRLEEYIRLNKELKFEELMEYIHPSLFKLAPKDQLIEVFKKVYDNDEMKISIDNLEKRSISDLYALNGVQYHKVDYYMVMRMKFKDESKTLDSSFVNSMTTSLEAALPKKKVSYDAAGNQFFIKGTDVLMAIKDSPKSNWLFLGYDAGNEIIKQLLPMELIEHFNLQ